MEEKNINVEKEEKEEKKKGFVFFYVVIGVATLIIAIIGASFAYFSANAVPGDDSDPIEGYAAKAGLSLKITRLSTGATGGLIPLNTGDLQKAVTGTPAGSPVQCVDDNGNTVCQIYSIEVTNGDSTKSYAATAVNGTLDLQPDRVAPADDNSRFTNLKWQLLENASTVETDTTKSPIHTSGESIDKPNITRNTVISGEPGSNTHTWYLVIWIHNINEAQESIDYGNFKGTVTFNAATGPGVVGTFSS